MAFPFANATQAGGGSVNPQVQEAPSLQEVFTEGLGFSSLNGDKKLRLLPSPWPNDALPPSTSSLLSIAPKKGLVAAASPGALIIATTESVRQTLTGSGAERDGVKEFTPQLTIPVPRLSHVAFSSNESFLVIVAETGGGLAVYNVQSLLQNNTTAAFQIGTNEIPVRGLIPNPNPEFEEFFSIILNEGKLMLAELKEQKLINGPNGQSVLKEGVSCVSWSAKGKQLVAGLADGTAFQIKPTGEGVAAIPRPPNVGPDKHVSSIYWLANEEFLVVHCPNNPPTPPPGDERPDFPELAYHLIQANKERTSFTFSKFEDPCPLMDSVRAFPPQNFILRLKKWAPALADMLIIASTGSSEIGLLTNSDIPLAQDAPTKTYTNTNLAIDSRRAQLPTSSSTGDEMNDIMVDPSAIGLALDLSSKEKVLRPVPMEEEITESPTPLPALYVLNNEGLLCAWWVVYNESIKQGTGYSGLVALGEAQSVTPGPAPSQPTSMNAGTAFAKPSPSPFGKPAALAFGSSGFATGGATFGKSTFGASTPLGSSAGTPAFGKSTFGTSIPLSGSPAAPAFGSTGGIGNRASPWATAGPTPQKPSQPQQSPFSNPGGASGFSKFATGNSTTASPLSSFGGTSGTLGSSGFAALGQQKPAQPAFASNSTPSFGGMSTEPSFGSTVTVGSSLGGSTLPSWANTPAQPSGSLFGQQSASFTSTKESDMGDADDDAQNRERSEATPTPQVSQAQPKGLFGMNSGSFKIESTFKGDGTAKDDLPKPTASSSLSLFGEGFSKALGGAKPAEPITPIKKEPGTENQISLGDISTAPAAPPKAAEPKEPATWKFPGIASTTTGTKPPESESEKVSPKPVPSPPAESPVVEEPPAPLPPDPMTFKPTKNVEDELPPLAGSPAIQIEAPSSIPSSPAPLSDHDAGAISVEEQEDDEEPSPSDEVRRPTTQATWSFSNSLTAERLSRGVPPQAPTPPTKSASSSRSRNQSRSPSRSPVRPSLFQQSSTPAGFPKAVPIFPPPSRIQDSLRSPSPVRSASTSALNPRRQPLVPAPVKPTVPPSSLQLPKAPTPPPEVSDLSDDEDEKIRQELQSNVVPSRRLDPFIAHQDYAGTVTKPGIPGQIERVYRDINSMIDTLGINARSLSAFMKFHTEPQHAHERTREDLEEVLDKGEDGDWDEDWCLVELEDLMVLEHELEQSLDAGRVSAVHDKLLQLSALQRDVAKLRVKVTDVRQQIHARSDPEKLEFFRMQPLPPEQAEQQRALRASFATLMKNLSEAEEAIVLLKTRLASMGGQKTMGKQVPTVEAVTNTILKMTSMIEKKSGDIDVLETQMRKLRMGSEALMLRSSRAGTPARDNSAFTTPPTSRGRMAASMRSDTEDSSPGKTFGLFYTPDGTPTRGPNGWSSAILKAAGASGLDEEELEIYKEKAVKRKVLTDRLAAALLARGTRVTTVGN
ncbi:hypothetical protein AOQ84DRAFT_312162 [Glonium stellatum]|uniref:Nucleoporin Nup159/Nup146 N-terminal domain-containing protein n=1 Tax=Glonium stellatum TaxID=574774 RepID=A0A8E2F8G8_9PEZI|nr:hypothetical protein AOQ84DRAFT_312162 [Glonium stellatum]